MRDFIYNSIKFIDGGLSRNDFDMAWDDFFVDVEPNESNVNEFVKWLII